MLSIESNIKKNQKIAAQVTAFLPQIQDKIREKLSHCLNLQIVFKNGSFTFDKVITLRFKNLLGKISALDVKEKPEDFIRLTITSILDAFDLLKGKLKDKEDDIVLLYEAADDFLGSYQPIDADLENFKGQFQAEFTVFKYKEKIEDFLPVFKQNLWDPLNRLFYGKGHLAPELGNQLNVYFINAFIKHDLQTLYKELYVLLKPYSGAPEILETCLNKMLESYSELAQFFDHLKQSASQYEIEKKDVYKFFKYIYRECKYDETAKEVFGKLEQKLEKLGENSLVNVDSAVEIFVAACKDILEKKSKAPGAIIKKQILENSLDYLAKNETLKSFPAKFIEQFNSMHISSNNKEIEEIKEKSSDYAGILKELVSAETNQVEQKKPLVAKILLNLMEKIFPQKVSETIQQELIKKIAIFCNISNPDLHYLEKILNEIGKFFYHFYKSSQGRQVEDALLKISAQNLFQLTAQNNKYRIDFADKLLNLFSLLSDSDTLEENMEKVNASCKDIQDIMSNSPTPSESLDGTTSFGEEQKGTTSSLAWSYKPKPKQPEPSPDSDSESEITKRKYKLTKSLDNNSSDFQEIHQNSVMQLK